MGGGGGGDKQRHSNKSMQFNKADNHVGFYDLYILWCNLAGVIVNRNPSF